MSSRQTEKYFLNWGGQVHTQRSGSSPVTVWYNELGLELQRDSYGLNGRKISTNTEYTGLGEVRRVSEPYFETDAGSKTWAAIYTYDDYRRTASVTTPQGITSYTYSGKQTSVTSPEGTATTLLNSAGQVVCSTQNGKSVNYTYYPSGLTKTATPQDGLPVNMEYDMSGNRTRLSDPDAGTITSEYNAFGELKWTKQKIHDSNDVTTNYTYTPNGLIRNVTRIGKVAHTTSYVYYKGSQILSIQIAGGHKQTFDYDDLDRMTSVEEQIDGRSYYRSFIHGQYGRIEGESYPSGYYIINKYDTYGNLTEVRDKFNNPIWKAIDENARRQLTAERWGNNKIKTYDYDSRGFLTEISSPGVIDLEYSFNAEGNLAKRRDNLKNKEERFIYDNMNRLTNWNVYTGFSNLLAQNSISYNSTTSNIASKSGIGTDFTYHPGIQNFRQPHALLSYNGGSFIMPFHSVIAYTDFKKVESISQSGESYRLTYGVDEQRRKSTHTKDGCTTTRYYMGDYEEEIDHDGNIKKIHYLKGAVFIQDDEGNNLLFTHTDYQGSLIALTDADGNEVERYAYDPWGNRRDPNDWTQKDTRTSFKLNCGYTGHEHLDGFNLINMNGRMYDPVTSQFFSPDPYVQAPGNWLNYNRYGYCLNNPMKYIDPTGEIAWFVPVIIGAVVGAYTGASIQSGTAAFWNWSSNAWQGAIAGAFIGATAGGMFSAAIGATGMTTVAANGTNVATKAWGVTNTLLQSSSINIGMNAISGGGWDGAWKAGIVGAAAGGWSATGGFGLANSDLAGKLSYQMIGSAGNSIGNNWAAGDDPFSKISLGIGPISLTFGKGQKLLQWQNNLGNIAFNSVGLLNLAFNGNVQFDWDNLAPVYSGGLIEKVYGPLLPADGTGAHVVFSNTKEPLKSPFIQHEMRHVWQSRSLGDMFLIHYFTHGILPIFMRKDQYYGNYFEKTAEYGF